MRRNSAAPLRTALELGKRQVSQRFAPGCGRRVRFLCMTPDSQKRLRPQAQMHDAHDAPALADLIGGKRKRLLGVPKPILDGETRAVDPYDLFIRQERI